MASRALPQIGDSLSARLLRRTPASLSPRLLSPVDVFMSPGVQSRQSIQNWHKDSNVSNLAFSSQSLLALALFATLPSRRSG